MGSDRIENIRFFIKVIYTILGESIMLHIIPFRTLGLFNNL